MQPIGGIEQACLPIAEEWIAAEVVRVPEDEVAAAEFAETKLAPIAELGGDVGAGVGDYDRRLEEIFAKERQGERGEGDRETADRQKIEADVRYRRWVAIYIG